METSHQENLLQDSLDQDCPRVLFPSVYFGAFFNEKMVPVTTLSSQTANLAREVFSFFLKKIIFMLLGALEAWPPEPCAVVPE